jgi:hypothetical protein
MENNICFVKEAGHGARIARVLNVELDAGRDIGRIAAVAEAVTAADVMAAAHEGLGQVAAQKAGHAGDEYAPWRSHSEFLHRCLQAWQRRNVVCFKPRL